MWLRKVGSSWAAREKHNKHFKEHVKKLDVRKYVCSKEKTQQILPSKEHDRKLAGALEVVW